MKLINNQDIILSIEVKQCIMLNHIIEVSNEKGIKQAQLTETLGDAKQWFSKTVQSPHSKINEIADAIGCDVTDLIVSKKKK